MPEALQPTAILTGLGVGAICTAETRLTGNEHVAVLLAASLAVHTTFVTPTGNVEPSGGVPVSYTI